MIEPSDAEAEYPLRFGAAGSAAVYTDSANVLRIVRKVMLRIES